MDPPKCMDILVIGHVCYQKYSKFTFHILFLNPTIKKDVHFLKYHIYTGRKGNRGNGQMYPNGKRNNINATRADIISKISNSTMSKPTNHIPCGLG